MLRKKVAFLLLRSLYRICRRWSVPLSLIYFLRWFGGKEITRLPGFSSTLSWNITTIKDIEISNIIPVENISSWALDVETLNFIIHYITKYKPQAILEFGSGISTICLVKAMMKIHYDSSKIFVYSIEENYNFVKLVENWLQRACLGKFAKILHAPLIEQTIEGEKIRCYYLPTETLNKFLNGVKPNLIIIDGPSGKKGARFGTLPLVKDFVQDGAIFFLDDGFRDEELRVVQKWMRLPYIKITGFHLIGKGLVEGRIQRQCK